MLCYKLKCVNIKCSTIPIIYPKWIDNVHTLYKLGFTTYSNNTSFYLYNKPPYIIGCNNKVCLSYEPTKDHFISIKKINKPVTVLGLNDTLTNLQLMDKIKELFNAYNVNNRI